VMRSLFCPRHERSSGRGRWAFSVRQHTSDAVEVSSLASAAIRLIASLTGADRRKISDGDDERSTRLPLAGMGACLSARARLIPSSPGYGFGCYRWRRAPTRLVAYHGRLQSGRPSPRGTTAATFRGRIGFDPVPQHTLTAFGALDLRYQSSRPICERQRKARRSVSRRPSEVLVVARAASDTTGLSRVALHGASAVSHAVVEVPTNPRHKGCRRALIGGYARERGVCERTGDAGSIPAGSTSRNQSVKRPRRPVSPLALSRPSQRSTKRVRSARGETVFSCQRTSPRCHPEARGNEQVDRDDVKPSTVCDFLPLSCRWSGCTRPSWDAGIRAGSFLRRKAGGE